MKIYITKELQKWQISNKITKTDIIDSVHEMENGLIDAGLGGGLYKKRIAAKGKGKRGGARLIIATKMNGIWFLIHGFPKNASDNISAKEDKQLRYLAKILFALTDIALASALAAKELIELIVLDKEHEK